MNTGVWGKLFGGADARGDEGLRVPLRVVARGICCAVGHNAPAASAAMRARLNHFRETDFVSRGGHPVVGAALYEVDLWGTDRLRAMLNRVVDECVEQMPGVPLSKVSLVVITTAAERPGPHVDLLKAELAELVAVPHRPGERFHRTSLMGAVGKAGIAEALRGVARLLQQSDAPTHAILIGVDSLLNAVTIELLLAQERLVTPENADGLIPGEAAAGVVLTSAPGTGPALWIESAASAYDEWRHGGDAPMRAGGLTQVMRTASLQAGTRMADLDFHASGMTGESWYAKEVALALSRGLEERVATFTHENVVRSVGEVGAACGVLSLAWLAYAMGRLDGPGRSGLLHLADDAGQRAAMVVRYR